LPNRPLVLGLIIAGFSGAASPITLWPMLGRGTLSVLVYRFTCPPDEFSDGEHKSVSCHGH
jgi:hypothetical protein